MIFVITFICRIFALFRPEFACRCGDLMRILICFGEAGLRILFGRFAGLGIAEIAFFLGILNTVECFLSHQDVKFLLVPQIVFDQYFYFIIIYYEYYFISLH